MSIKKIYVRFLQTEKMIQQKKLILEKMTYVHNIMFTLKIYISIVYLKLITTEIIHVQF